MDRRQLKQAGSSALCTIGGAAMIAGVVNGSVLLVAAGALSILVSVVGFAHLYLTAPLASQPPSLAPPPAPPPHAPPDIPPAEAASAEPPTSVPIESKLARIYQLERMIPRLEGAYKESEEAFQNWLRLSEQKIYGAGLVRGNHRHYRMAHDKWRERVDAFQATIINSNIENGRDISNPPGSFLAKVRPEEVLLKHTPNVNNLYNFEGNALDEDRRTQHRVWYEQHERTALALREYMGNLKSELSTLRREVGEAARS